MLRRTLMARAAGGGDPYFASVTSLVHFDDANGTTAPIDIKGHAWVGNGHAQVSTTAPLTGTGSALLDGAGDYFSRADHVDFELGSGDFTIEIDASYAGLPTASGAMALASKYRNVGGNVSWMFYLFNSGGSLRLYFTYSTNGTATTNTFVAWTPSVGVKYKLCVERNGGSLRFYVNGTQQGATQAISGTLYDGVATVMLGQADATVSYYHNGKLDEFRLTKGIARYVGNYTPAEPFPNS